MKKSNLYSIYALLFVIIANVVENRLVIGLASVAALLHITASLIFAYLEDKYN